MEGDHGGFDRGMAEERLEAGFERVVVGGRSWVGGDAGREPKTVEKGGSTLRRRRNSRLSFRARPSVEIRAGVETDAQRVEGL